jgi:hypothetical protein
MQKSTPKASCEAFVPARIAFVWLVALAFIAGIGLPSPARALSEIQREDVPGTTQANPPDGTSDTPIEKQTLPPVGTVPIPDSTTSPPAEAEPAAPVEPDEAAPDDEAPDHEGSPDAARPDVDPDAPIPEIVYNLDRLPEPVRRMHDLLVEASKTGDVEKLRPLLDTGEEGTQLSLGGTDGDPIALLRGESGDKEGIEILAILEEVLSAGYVHMDPGTPNEMYVWPYFFAVPLEKLTAGQKVELFKIITAGDYEEMKSYGSYIFYRVGITPEGRWSFFVAGD